MLSIPVQTTWALKSFRLYMGMYIVIQLSSSARSMTLTSTNVVPNFFFFFFFPKNGTVGRKAHRILIVWESISLLMHPWSSCTYTWKPQKFPTLHGAVYSHPSCHLQQRRWPLHQLMSIPQKISKMEPWAERLVKFWWCESPSPRWCVGDHCRHRRKNY